MATSAAMRAASAISMGRSRVEVLSAMRVAFAATGELRQ